MPNRAQRRAAERQAQTLAANASEPMLAQQAPTGSPETMLAQQAPTGSPETMLAKQAPTGSPETMLAQQAPTGSPETMLAQQAPTDAVQSHGTTCTGSPETLSDARLTANRANAQHSTGPRTEEGKAKSSLNAVKTGLTGRTVLLPTDDALIYQQHLDRTFAKFSPATDDEHILVQTIADTEWRLLRIAPLEATIYAIGRLQLADQFAEHSDPVIREALILGKIFMTYRRDLSNLALQERRLRNQRKTDLVELEQLQKARAEKRSSQVQRALTLNNNAAAHHLNLDLADHGFDFSVYELQAYSKQNRDQKRLTETDLDFDHWLAIFRAAQKEPKAA